MSEEFGIKVKEDSANKIVLEYWTLPEGPSLFAYIKSLFLTDKGSKNKEKPNDNDVVLDETIIVDFDVGIASSTKVLPSGETEKTSLDLKDVSAVRVQMEEHGHHFRLYLDSPNNDAFQVSIAFSMGSYTSTQLHNHGRKIGKMLKKPVVRQHTDLGSILSEETLQA